MRKWYLLVLAMLRAYDGEAWEADAVCGGHQANFTQHFAAQFQVTCDAVPDFMGLFVGPLVQHTYRSSLPLVDQALTMSTTVDIASACQSLKKMIPHCCLTQVHL